MRTKFILLCICAILIFPVFSKNVEAREFGQWETKFGFAGQVGNATYLDDGAIMEGFGAAWYSRPVSKQVGVKFQMNKKVNNYSYIIALMNKPNVGWNLNGKEAQGIVLQIRSWQSEEGMGVDVFKVTGQGEKGIENIGHINSSGLPMNTDHTVAIYKNEGKWKVAIDGGDALEMDATGLNFDTQMYLTAGSVYGESDNYARVKNLQMSIHAVYVDEEMPSSYYSFLEKEKEVNGWTRIRGYGMNNADNGKELSVVNGKVVMEGYGGCAYTASSVHDAVAVDFELNEFNIKKSYFFTFGLVNKKRVYINSDGSESQGITVRISSYANGQGLNVDVWYISQAGAEHLGTIKTSGTSKNTTHTFAIFREDGKWYAGINGQQKMSIDLDVELGDESYLVAGAAAYKELKMSINKVYIDDAVTKEMKAGILKASSKATGVSNSLYGPGGTSFSLANFVGEFRTAAETGNLGNLITRMIKSLTWYQWLLIAAIGISITSSIVFVVRERKKTKNIKVVKKG